MRKFLASAVICAMAFSFAGCGDDKPKSLVSMSKEVDLMNGANTKAIGKVSITEANSKDVTDAELLKWYDYAENNVGDKGKKYNYAIILYKDKPLHGVICTPNGVLQKDVTFEKQKNGNYMIDKDGVSLLKNKKGELAPMEKVLEEFEKNVVKKSAEAGEYKEIKLDYKLSSINQGKVKITITTNLPDGFELSTSLYKNDETAGVTGFRAIKNGKIEADIVGLQGKPIKPGRYELNIASAIPRFTKNEKIIKLFGEKGEKFPESDFVKSSALGRSITLEKNVDIN